MKNLVNQNIVGLEAYVPGEQPTDPDWVKLNTNENPFPPAPQVVEVLRSFDPELIRRYPQPDSAPLREAIAQRLDWPADGIVVTNGSDEALRMLCHAFLNRGERIAMLEPTYSLYPILGRMFGAESLRSRVGRGGELPDRLELDGAKMFFLANPNPPFGTHFRADELAGIIALHEDILFVIDEAYVEFAPSDCLGLLHEFENVLVVRTFSKSHALAGLRVGFVLGDPDRIAPLWVVRDSYNVNALSQAAALAAWQARDYYRLRTARIVEARRRAEQRLGEMGFDVLPSEANFLFARHHHAPRIFMELKKRKILVRYFDSPETRDGLRITVGTDEQMETLYSALSEILERAI